MNNQEIYAVVEIHSQQIKFIVFSFHKSQINVLFSSLARGEFCQKGLVTNPKNVGKIISSMVKKANDQLLIVIKRVALNLVSSSLNIRQGQAIIEINDPQHRINNEDINNLIAMSKNISLADDEVICLMRPYKYIIDNSKRAPYPPINELASSVAVNSLIYTINKAVYESHLAALQCSRLELLSLVLMPFCHAWATFSRQELQNGAIIIDFDFDNTQISIFVKETLYALNVIEYGFNDLITDLQYVLQSSRDLAQDYLLKIININNNFLDDKIIYSKYDYDKNQYLEYSHQTLKNVVIDRIEAVVTKIKTYLQDILKNRNLPIIFLGEITKISGFRDFLIKANIFKMLRFYNSNIIGAKDQIYASLIGNAYYQHLLNKNTIAKVFSIDKITRDPKYLRIPEEHQNDYAHKY